MADSDLVTAAAWRLDALTHMHDKVQGGPTKDEPVELVVALKALAAAPVVSVDEDALAQKIAALILPAVVAANASAVADEIAKRLGNG